MNKKPINREELFMILITSNIVLGLCIGVFPDLIRKMILEGLYHKILIFSGVTIPIGFITMIALSSIFAILFYLIIKIDVIFFKKYNIIKVDNIGETVK